MNGFRSRARTESWDPLQEKEASSPWFGEVRAGELATVDCMLAAGTDVDQTAPEAQMTALMIAGLVSRKE